VKLGRFGGGTTPAHRRGFALIAILSLIALISAFLIASAMNRSSADLSNEREDRNMTALRQAKAALIAFAADTEGWQKSQGLAIDQPGALPCPDILQDDGTSNCVGAGISSNTSLIGRVPWKTMGTEDLRDASGERLWYALSYNFRKNFGTTVINSDTPGQLSVSGPAAASNIVAIVFAPGPPLPGLGQNRPADITTAAHNDPANYLEGVDTSNATNYTFTSSALPSNSNNDRLLVITQAELMAAVEPVVAARIERDIAPYVQDYYSTWGIYPFAATFSATGVAGKTQLDYKGSAGQTSGLLPLSTDPNDSSWAGWQISSIGVTDLTGGGGGGVGSWNCGTSTTSQIVCTITYGTSTTDRPTIQLQATLNKVASSFLIPVTDSNVSMIDGNGSSSTWSTSVSHSLTTTLQNTGDAVFVATGRLRRGDTTNGQETIRISFSFHPITSNADPQSKWFIVNQWFRQTYYAASPGYILGGGSGCNALPPPPSAPPFCLTVNNLRPSYTTWNDKRAILILTGRSLNGTPRPSTIPANYLENANATGNATLVYENRSGVPTAINDRVVVISP